MGFLDKFKFKKKPFKEGTDTDNRRNEALPRSDDKVKKTEKVSDSVKVEKSTKQGKDKNNKKNNNNRRDEALPRSTSRPEPRSTSRSAKKSRKEDTGNAYRVLIKPIISEKVTDLGAIDQYAFEVSLKSTKNEIKKAVKSVY